VLMDALSHAKPTQTCYGEDQTIKLPTTQFFETGNHIAANILKAEMGKLMTQLCESSQGTGTGGYHGSIGEGTQTKMNISLM